MKSIANAPPLNTYVTHSDNYTLIDEKSASTVFFFFNDTLMKLMIDISLHGKYEIHSSREQRMSLPLYKSYRGGLISVVSGIITNVPYISLVAEDVIGTIFHQLLNLFINVNTLLVKLS